MTKVLIKNNHPKGTPLIVGGVKCYVGAVTPVDKEAFDAYGTTKAGKYYLQFFEVTKRDKKQTPRHVNEQSLAKSDVDQVVVETRLEAETEMIDINIVINDEDVDKKKGKKSKKGKK